MRIKEVTAVYRNDFEADMECECCGHESKLGSGYNDSNYHNKVIPNMKCGVCMKSSVDIQKDIINKAFDYGTGLPL